jgi:predicted helicase
VEQPITKIENLTKKFRAFLDEKYHQKFKIEEIIGYIYGVLHSPTYRKKYSSHLKIDFPRINFTDDEKIFKILSSLGWELAQIHLMKNRVKKNEKIGAYSGDGNNEIVKVEYVKDRKTGWNNIKINSSQYFENVSPEIFNFHIGGYQVLDKYLKDRKGRQLILDEIENVENIVKVIDFTIKQMEEIDNLTKDWI